MLYHRIIPQRGLNQPIYFPSPRRYGTSVTATITAVTRKGIIITARKSLTQITVRARTGLLPEDVSEGFYTVAHAAVHDAAAQDAVPLDQINTSPSQISSQ